MTKTLQKLKRIDRYRAAVAALFALGIFVRLVGLSSFVPGINADEASAGYDAFGIAFYGMDRNLVKLPAYLIAWGSGQNAGYTWLLVPFVRLFGLSVSTVRLPMALAGCASLWALYTILRRHADKRLALWGLFLLAICPWHIVKSRWALESNLLPDVLLWGVALLCTGLAGGKKRWFYLSFFTFGLACWCYATSFVLMPLFLIPVAFILWRRKSLGLLHIAGCFGVFLLACWPIILFSIVNLFGLGSIYLPFITIPRLPASRENEVAFLAQQPIQELINNAKSLLSMLLAQDDGNSWSVVQGFGLIYIFSLPLAAVGLLRSVLPKDKGGKFRGIVPGSWLFLPLAAAAVVMALLIPPSVNRSNALWFPLVWYWVLGVYDIASVSAFWRRFTAGLYAVFFLLFCNSYLKVQADRLNDSFDTGFLEAVEYVDSLDKPVYVSGAGPPYIKVLFALQPSPQVFRDSVIYEETGSYGNVFEWDKWTVAEPDSPALSDDYAIIIRSGKEGPYLEAGWQLENFGYFWAGQAP